ncbi:hypothetical protein PATY110618_14155 [Paenibacillus typhae]|uniref:Uncharacterized protein n=1 Tax=Paenibacillus typhae TaxID=1174501 RepID=A0A1G8V2X5_9BACL|nr:hypothetical protein SAMN05216192_12028 [Paenibacillus typhae]
MLKKVWSNNPRWFTVLWAVTITAYIGLMLFHETDQIMTVLMAVLFTAAGVRDWNRQRKLALFSYFLAVVFIVIYIINML